MISTHALLSSLLTGVIFTTLPSPPDDVCVAESYVNELDTFTGLILISVACTSLFCVHVYLLYVHIYVHTCTCNLSVIGY